jgi:hypothetical protein
MILEPTHQIRQALQLCERRLAVQPRHDCPKLLSQCKEDSSIAEDVERSYAQCPGCGGRSCSQNDPALIHQARHCPLFGRDAGVSEGIKYGIVVGALAPDASLQGQPRIFVDGIDPCEGLGVLWEQDFEEQWRDADHETAEDREESVDVEPNGEDSRAVLNVVDDACVVPQVTVALTKVTMADDVCGEICEQALEFHRLIRGVRSPELLVQELCGCLDHRAKSL